MKMRPIPMPKASEQPARPKKIKNEGEKQSPNSFNDKLEGSRKVNADTKENLKSEKVSKDDVKKDVAVNPKAKGLQDASEIKPNLNPQITKLLGKDSKVQIAKESKHPDVDVKSSKSLKNSTKKKLDKDSLNQSIAGSQFIQNEEAVKEVSLKDVSVKEVSVNNDKIKVDNLNDYKGGQNETSSKEADLTPLSGEGAIKGKKALEAKTKDKNSKSRDKKIEPKITVRDVRNNKELHGNRNVKVNHNVENPDNQKAEHFEAGADKNIMLGTTEISAEGEGGKAQAPVMKEFSSLLKQQLKDFGNDSIVKQSRFILKDNNIGEIKLILKPESMGQVKINLELNENSLAGRIIVENNSVKEVFQENINQLSKSLEEQGYDSAKLNVSLSDKKGSNPRDEKESKQYFSERLKRIDDQVIRYGSDNYGINLTA